ncbi:chitinase [Streptomyces montanisoli]|uniref:Chitinase n=1 Tax=Streptomyces montanisoli TaxID=2798581 RepID=A0A940MB06_9ACTN|nr:chitinase [Streptomyces montanisoli]MBP0456725.1 chitinase [Streptomyces montanisoli]
MRRIRHATAGLATAALAASAALASGGTASAAPAAGATTFAPYTDMSNGQEGLLDTAITQHGVKTFTAAFVIGSGCNAIWGDTLPVGGDSYTDPLIKKAQSEGASVIVSNGGAAGYPLGWTCTDQSAIKAGYQKIISAYGVKSLDFDIEGGAVADQTSAVRNWTVMKQLKDANPGLTVSATLPVLPSGLTQDGVNILKSAKSAGLKLDVVNAMTMDYYQGNQDMGQAAIKAGQATLAQMKSVDSSYTYANLGITPMAGTNDDGSTFTLADAATVKNWAASNGVGRLSMWSVNRDQSCGGSFALAASSTCSGVSQAKLAFTDALK